MLAILLATLSGTLFIYQGQEIGMVDAPESWPMGEYKDVESNNYYNCVSEKSNGNPVALARSKRVLQHLARDPYDSRCNGMEHFTLALLYPTSH